MQERILDQLCGHVPATIGGRYGDGADLPALKGSLDRLRFTSVDWPGLEAAAKVIVWPRVVEQVIARADAGSKAAA